MARDTKIVKVAVAVVLALFGCGPTNLQPQAFSDKVVGKPGSGAPGELFLPAGNGPHPAMVVLHGCDGVGAHYRDWARRLADWGYVALLVDSFHPRGVLNVCNHGMEIPPLLRAQDAFAAADYLRTRSDVIGDEIGVIGFSHGGWTVLKAVLEGNVAADHARPFEAAVAFYPACQRPESPLASDTLILIGDTDDWTPVGNCLRWRDGVQRDGHALVMKVYPGALHGFDSSLPPHIYAGHHVGRNDAAAEDAAATTRAFLAARLPQTGS